MTRTARHADRESERPRVARAPIPITTRSASRRPRRSSSLRGLTLYRGPYEVAKRILDLACSLLLLPFALPVMSLCAFLIWRDEGRPILFTQQRTGKAGRRFTLYKFRTMVKDAPEQKLRLQSRNQLSGPDFKIADDPRVTPLGEVMRKYSLDELPQIYNVLRGDMSLVGPRPTSFEASTYDLWHTERLEITPGLSGLWQVSGRSDVDFDERVRLDIEYVERRSLLFDLWILIKTVKAVLRPRGAY